MIHPTAAIMLIHIVAFTVVFLALLWEWVRHIIPRGTHVTAEARAHALLAAHDGELLSDAQYCLVGELDEKGQAPAVGADGRPVGAAVTAEGVAIPVMAATKFPFERFAARLAAEAKIALGYNLKPTEANRMVVHDWLHRRMHKANVRTQHIVQVLPRAIVLTFLKTREEVELDEALNSEAMRQRNLESRTLPEEREGRGVARLVESAVGWVFGRSVANSPPPLKFK